MYIYIYIYIHIYIYMYVYVHRSFNELTEQFTSLRRVQAVSTRYFELLDREPKIATREGAKASSLEKVKLI